ncbi:AAA family ATPase [Fusobacterium ulcerans]
MKINFKNLGPIKEGTIDLKKLNIFCGENNTGKTYLNYLIYTIFKIIKSYGFIYKMSDSFKLVSEEELEEKLEILVNLEEIFNNKIDIISDILEKSIKKELPKAFNTNMNFFNKFEITIQIEKESFKFFSNKSIAIDRTRRYELMKNKNEYTYKIIVKERISEIIPKSVGVKFLNNVLIRRIMYGIFGLDNISNIFFLPAERSGLSIFYNELLLNRSNILDRFVRNENDDLYLENIISRYPEPINDFINFLALVPDLMKGNKKSKYFELAENIEKTILHGTYHVENKRISFKNEENIETELHISSSMIKTISGIIFYLKYVASKGSYFFIDEPELNLHPDNQRKIARIFAQMINSGIKIVMTTHSPYIINELNNLLMLSRNISNVRKEQIMNDYQIVKKDIISPENVVSYLVKDNKIEEMEQSEFGILVDTFNDVIDSMNNLSNELYFAE